LQLIVEHCEEAQCYDGVVHEKEEDHRLKMEETMKKMIKRSLNITLRILFMRNHPPISFSKF
jgi:hypothetical protein